MPCYRPIDAYVVNYKNENGKKDITFKKVDNYKERINLPCGQCIGCRLQRSIMWASRCVHEMSQHKASCFITLTYDDNHLPSDYSLTKYELQKFFKRLRKVVDVPIRYFACGEYGDSSWRPHYHSIIFGYDFPDKIIYNSESQYSISPLLDKVWKKGFSIVAPATFDTAAYVARYCVKKVNGDKADEHYKRQIIDWNEYTGEIYENRETDLLPEFAVMSRRPGIGREWFNLYKCDCYPSDFLIVKGRKVPVPRYYDKLLENEDAYMLRVQKMKRRIHAMLEEKDNSLSRLKVKETIKQKQITSLERLKI